MTSPLPSKPTLVAALALAIGGPAGAQAPPPTAPDPQAELARVRAERDALQKELSSLQAQGARLAAAELQVQAAKLSDEIKKDFFEWVKTALWVGAGLLAASSLFGWLQLSKFLGDRLDARLGAALDARTAEVGRLRKAITDELVDLRLRIADAKAESGRARDEAAEARGEVGRLRAETSGVFAALREEASREKEEAVTAIRGIALQARTQVDAQGRIETRVRPIRAKTGPARAPRPERAAAGEAAKIFGRIPAGVVAIRSAGAEQEPLDWQDGLNFTALFGRAMTERLADENGDGKVSLREAVAWVAENAPFEAKPVVGGSDVEAALFTLLPEPPEGKGGTLRALLVGTSVLERGEARLFGPGQDVPVMAELLRDDGRRIMRNLDAAVLVDSEATARAIEDALGRVVSAAAPEDQVLFYHSGHSLALDDAGDGRRHVRALVPYDFSAGNLPLPRVVERLGESRAKQKVLIFDA